LVEECFVWELFFFDSFDYVLRDSSFRVASFLSHVDTIWIHH